MTYLTILLSLIVPLGGFDFVADYTVSYSAGGVVTLSWTLNKDAESLLLFRGDKLLKILDGNATSFQLTETEPGRYQYSLGWRSHHGVMLQWETKILDLGRFTWKAPQEGSHWDGYVVFISETPLIDDLTPSIKIDEPLALAVLLKDLPLDSGEAYYLAVASYRTVGLEYMVSDHTDPLLCKFTYLDLTIPWAPPQAPSDPKLEF